MNAACPQCETEYNLPGGRGQRVSNHHCPDCDVPLRGITAGRSEGRFRCPVSGSLVTVGLTGVRLAEPMVLIFHAGWDPIERDRDRTEPNLSERAALERVGGRVLGAGCVVASGLDPHRHDSADPELRDLQQARAEVRLVPAEDPGDPETWLVNERLVYRHCVGCRARVIDQPERRMPEPWTPRRARIQLARGRSKPVAPGPHPEGSIACPDCEPARRS